MSYLDTAASDVYLTLTQIGRANNLVSYGDYVERLELLKQAIDPNKPEQLTAVSLWLEDAYRWEGRNDLPYKYVEGGELGNGVTEQVVAEVAFQGNDFDPLIHFICKAAGKVSKWEFHKGDSDGVPSVPHGHAIVNHKIKLDPYLGYITKNNQPYGREARQYIIDLWNDADFRQFAKEAIQHYLKTYPLYRWRVSDPSRLPRSR